MVRNCSGRKPPQVWHAWLRNATRLSHPASQDERRRGGCDSRVYHRPVVESVQGRSKTVEREMRLPGCFGGIVVAAALSAQTIQYPGMVLRGGKVITMDGQDRIAEAVAVTGNRITAAGSNADLAPMVGPHTQVIE